jgi:diketogulonate reductase-like aldo/keto reductase
VTDINSSIKLANVYPMPRLGLGTWLLSDPSVIDSVVRAALEVGYRRIDTASAYENETALGSAIGSLLKSASRPRKELFITGKAWIAEQRPGQTIDACKRSLERLGLTYLDLYLLHWPVARNSLSAWEDMEKLLAEGLVKAIGVSNFQKNQLDEIIKLGGTKPMVNQIELHPLWTQDCLSVYCQRQGVVVDAYSPLARGKLKKNQSLTKIARKYSHTVTQVILRWHFQSGRAFIPKSSDPERVKENAGIFDFVLSPEDMAVISKQNQNRSVLTPKFKFDEGGWIIDDGGGS